MQRRPIPSDIDTAVYWRSDTRSPEKIFQSGFEAQSPKSDDYWKDCIRISEHEGMCDAMKMHCICMTTHFESAGFFPITRPGAVVKGYRPTYFYAIALPVSLKINASKALYHHGNYKPQHLEDAVIDMHSFQTEHASRLLNALDNDDPDYNKSVLMQGGYLCAYEAFASRVDTKNIIGAVKVLRGPSQAQSFLDLPLRSFNVTSEITLNSLFAVTQEMAVLDKQDQPVVERIDYSKRRNEAINQMKSAAGKSLQTPTNTFGLAGKTLGSPTTAPAKQTMQGLFARAKPSTPLKAMDDTRRYVL